MKGARDHINSKQRKLLQPKKKQKKKKSGRRSHCTQNVLCSGQLSLGAKKMANCVYGDNDLKPVSALISRASI